MEEQTTNPNAELHAESEIQAAAIPPEEHQKENRQPGKGWHKQPGSIAALLLILAAVVILTIWLTGRTGEEAVGFGCLQIKAVEQRQHFDRGVKHPDSLPFCKADIVSGLLMHSR